MSGGVENSRSVQQDAHIQRPIGTIPQGESGVIPVIGSGATGASAEGRVRLATPVLLPQSRVEKLSSNPTEPTVHRDKYGKLNGEALIYLKQSVDEETPWHGWDELANDRRLPCVVKGIITDDGIMAWSKQRDANHAHLQETITGEEGGTAEFFIVYPQASEKDEIEALIHIYGRPEQDDTALVLRTADYFVRNYQGRGRRMRLTLESHGEDGLFQTTTLQKYMDQRAQQKANNC